MFAFMTADIRIPDNTDTDVYGEATEAGHGETLESGWVNPTWARWEVWQDMSDVSPVAEYDETSGMTLDDWRADVVAEHLGSFHGSTGSTEVTPTDHTYYGTDSQENYATGASATYALHFWTREELATVSAPSAYPAEMSGFLD
jgi:hypothetical protein